MKLEDVKKVELEFKGYFPSEKGGHYEPSFNYILNPEDISIHIDSLLAMGEANKIDHLGRFGLGKGNITLNDKALEKGVSCFTNRLIKDLLENANEIYLKSIHIEYNRDYPKEFYEPIVELDCYENIDEAEHIKVNSIDNGVSIELNCDKFLNDSHANSINPESLLSIFVELVDQQTELFTKYNYEVLRLTNEEERLKSMTIADLDLSVRTYNVLKRYGINYIRELAQLTDDELSKIRNLREKNIKEIREKCNELGIETNFNTSDD